MQPTARELFSELDAFFTSQENESNLSPSELSWRRKMHAWNDHVKKIAIENNLKASRLRAIARKPWASDSEKVLEHLGADDKMKNEGPKDSNRSVTTLQTPKTLDSVKDDLKNINLEFSSFKQDTEEKIVNLQSDLGSRIDNFTKNQSLEIVNLRDETNKKIVNLSEKTEANFTRLESKIDRLTSSIELLAQSIESTTKRLEAIEAKKSSHFNIRPIFKRGLDNITKPLFIFMFSPRLWFYGLSMLTIAIIMGIFQYQYYEANTENAVFFEFLGFKVATFAFLYTFAGELIFIIASLWRGWLANTFLFLCVVYICGVVTFDKFSQIKTGLDTAFANDKTYSQLITREEELKAALRVHTEGKAIGAIRDTQAKLDQTRNEIQNYSNNSSKVDNSNIERSIFSEENKVIFLGITLIMFRLIILLGYKLLSSHAQEVYFDEKQKLFAA